MRARGSKSNRVIERVTEIKRPTESGRATEIEICDRDQDPESSRDQISDSDQEIFTSAVKRLRAT